MAARPPEKAAINLGGYRIPDNAGYHQVDVPIREDGETAYFTSLPVKAMVQRMRDAGIPAAVSYTAGTYVCNYLLDTLLYLIDKKYPNARWVHPCARCDGAGHQQAAGHPQHGPAPNCPRTGNGGGSCGGVRLK